MFEDTSYSVWDFLLHSHCMEVIMNPQGLNGPIRMCYSFQHLNVHKRNEILLKITKSPHISGNIDQFKWYIVGGVLHIEDNQSTR